MAYDKMISPITGELVYRFPNPKFVAPDDLSAPDRTTRLRHRLLEAGMKGAELGRRANIPQSRISEYVVGHRAITLRHLMKICEVLQVNPEQVQGWEPTRELDTARELLPRSNQRSDRLA